MFVSPQGDYILIYFRKISLEAMEYQSVKFYWAPDMCQTFTEQKGNYGSYPRGSLRGLTETILIEHLTRCMVHGKLLILFVIVLIISVIITQK